MNEDGVSIKAKNRIKKMMKPKILEREQKKRLQHENQPHSGRKTRWAGRIPRVQQGGHCGPQAEPQLLPCGYPCAQVTQRELKHLAWLPGMSALPSTIHSFPVRRADREHLLHLGTGARPPGPETATQPGFENPKPHTCAFSPLAGVRVIPSVEPHRPGVHAVVNGAILEVNGHRGERQ